MSADALRMRCRRLCERKPSGKYNIDAKVSEQYREGGSSREVLEMALLECIAKHGVIRSAYKKIKACKIDLFPLYDLYTSTHLDAQHQFEYSHFA